MNTRINYIIDLSNNKNDMKINRELNISINKIEYKTLGIIHKIKMMFVTFIQQLIIMKAGLNFIRKGSQL